MQVRNSKEMREAVVGVCARMGRRIQMWKRKEHHYLSDTADERNIGGKEKPDEGVGEVGESSPAGEGREGSQEHEQLAELRRQERTPSN